MAIASLEARDAEVVGATSETVIRTEIRNAPFVAGEVIANRYVIERVIAIGGAGVVLAAKHVELDETVAMKFLRPEFAARPELIGRFAREAKACARIKSEHTPTVLDVGVSAERGPYIVMEYLEGEDLQQRLTRRGALPIEEAVGIVLQACEAIASAHSNGIIHRDVKPENVFVTSRDGVELVKVLDFGISKATLGTKLFGTDPDACKTQSLMGSPIYMSPEQLRGSTDVGWPADIWGLGGVLYTLLAFRTPFSGKSVTEICAAVLETEPTRLVDLRDDVPAALSDVVTRCLDKDPRCRFASVAELALALAPFAARRARFDVERTLAISKAAGLVPLDFSATTLPPPPLTRFGPASPPSPPRPNAPSKPPVLRMELAVNPQSVLVGAALVAISVITVAIVLALWPSSPEAEASTRDPAATGATTTPAPPPVTPPPPEEPPLSAVALPAFRTPTPPPPKPVVFTGESSSTVGAPRATSTAAPKATTTSPSVSAEGDTPSRASTPEPSE